MARSRHTTRRDLREELRWNHSQAEGRKERLKKIRKELREKRTIKRLVSAERRQGSADRVGPIPVTAIPIRIRESGPFVHYPASPDELCEVLRRVPPGTADGIEEIELALGCARQKEYVLEEGCDPDEVDPHVGRHGGLDLPGVYCGHLLGVYDSPPGRIELYAYVYDPAIINRAIKETYLKVREIFAGGKERARRQPWNGCRGRGTQPAARAAEAAGREATSREKIRPGAASDHFREAEIRHGIYGVEHLVLPRAAKPPKRRSYVDGRERGTVRNRANPRAAEVEDRPPGPRRSRSESEAEEAGHPLPQIRTSWGSASKCWSRAKSRRLC